MKMITQIICDDPALIYSRQTGQRLVRLAFTQSNEVQEGPKKLASFCWEKKKQLMIFAMWRNIQLFPTM